MQLREFCQAAALQQRVIHQNDVGPRVRELAKKQVRRAGVTAKTERRIIHTQLAHGRANVCCETRVGYGAVFPLDGKQW
jgi:hypothetical protein